MSRYSIDAGDPVFNALLKLDMNAISAGFIEGAEYDLKFFSNEKVNSVEELLDFEGFTTYPFDQLAAGVSLEVVSSSAADSAAGVGARNIVIYGVDANFNEVQSATIALNGVTAVAIAGTWKGVYRARVVDAGTFDNALTSNNNVGNITIQVSGGGSAISVIPALKGSTLTSIRHVPAGHTMFIKSDSYSAGQNDNVNVALYVRNRADDISAAPYGCVRTIAQYHSRNGSFQQVYNGARAIPEKSVVFCTALNNSSGNTKISGQYEYFMINNSTFRIP